MEVLYIDDDPDDIDFFTEALKNVDETIELVHVDGCESALNHLRNSKVLSDVIFVDLHLPKIEGLECVKIIKADKLLSHIPIVVIATTIPSRDVDEFNKLGVYYFLSKTALLSKIEPALRVIIDSLCKGGDVQMPGRL
ncbi:MAG TPA: response regulator [Chryseolinea sp.]